MGMWTCGSDGDGAPLIQAGHLPLHPNQAQNNSRVSPSRSSYSSRSLRFFVFTLRLDTIGPSDYTHPPHESSTTFLRGRLRRSWVAIAGGRHCHQADLSPFEERDSAFRCRAVSNTVDTGRQRSRNRPNGGWAGSRLPRGFWPGSPIYGVEARCVSRGWRNCAEWGEGFESVTYRLRRDR